GLARARKDSAAAPGGAGHARSRGSADGPGRQGVIDSLVHRLFSAAQGARGVGDRDTPQRQGREQAMKTPPPASPEIEALLAPHRRVLPLAASVGARAIARAAAATVSPEPAAARVSGYPRWVFAVAAGLVLCAGAAAYAARAWIGTLLSRAPAHVAPIAPPPP